MAHILANIHMVEVSTSPVYTSGAFCQRVSSNTNPNSELRANKHWSLVAKDGVCVAFVFPSAPNRV